ncbi:transcriptional regulator NrdR [Fructilactobacillus fructivorans]|uniref:transcriptional regulator NrdR n=1 Tax=Fructilactobacillus fructivorans TaxID=1614 RepID=UPI0007049676|nr:transcriptional regulator NrdR [Fructilactobacillus fructivorans]KRN42524.1 transcriptional regulator NrdR [Fructilactobacillus fructivorans]
MQCPRCHHIGSKVLESRRVKDVESIRRRRECEECGFRFTTFEIIESTPLLVVKKNGDREEFNRSKILKGIVRSSEKRPVSMEQMNHIVDKVEKIAYDSDDGSHEVSSQTIGEGVMKGLKEVDEIAYIRFASVYRQFKDMSVFYNKLKELMDDEEENNEDKNKE